MSIALVAAFDWLGWEVFIASSILVHYFIVLVGIAAICVHVCLRSKKYKRLMDETLAQRDACTAAVAEVDDFAMLVSLKRDVDTACKRLGENSVSAKKLRGDLKEFEMLFGLGTRSLTQYDLISTEENPIRGAKRPIDLLKNQLQYAVITHEYVEKPLALKKRLEERIKLVLDNVEDSKAG